MVMLTANPANPANSTKRSGELSTEGNDLGFDLGQPSNLPSCFYWVKTNTDSSSAAMEKGRCLLSHIMRESHRQKRQEVVSMCYPKGTSEKKKIVRG